MESPRARAFNSRQPAEKWDQFDRAGLDDLREEGESRSAFVLRFTLSHPHVHTTIVGTSRIAHLEENVAAALRGPLPDDVYAEAKARLDSVGQSPVPGRLGRIRPRGPLWSRLQPTAGKRSRPATAPPARSPVVRVTNQSARGPLWITGLAKAGGLRDVPARRCSAPLPRLSLGAAGQPRRPVGLLGADHRPGCFDPVDDRVLGTGWDCDFRRHGAAIRRAATVGIRVRSFRPTHRPGGRLRIPAGACGSLVGTGAYRQPGGVADRGPGAD